MHVYAAMPTTADDDGNDVVRQLFLRNALFITCAHRRRLMRAHLAQKTGAAHTGAHTQNYVWHVMQLRGFYSHSGDR